MNANDPDNTKKKAGYVGVLGLLLIPLIVLCLMVIALLTLFGPTLGTWYIKTACGDPDTGSWEILTVSADGQDPATADQQNLTNSTGWEDAPRWSPDGTKIAYLVNNNNNTDIYIMNADGSAKYPLTTTPDQEWSPAWSPDGEWILYEVHRTLNESNLAVIPAIGGTPILLTHTPHPDHEAIWSPDGTQIAFRRSFSDGEWDLYLLTLPDDLSGEIPAPTVLTDEPGQEESPVWSHDGERIAFVSQNSAGNADIYIMNADGSSPVQITDSIEREFGLMWSSDGTQLLYTVYYLGQQKWSSAINSLDGSPPREIPTGQGAAWSPDGTRIAYVDSNQQITIVNSDGSGLVHLTEEPKFYRNDVHWSPNGTRIAFARSHEVCYMP